MVSAATPAASISSSAAEAMEARSRVWRGARAFRGRFMVVVLTEQLTY
jgi:hypothetical protein